MVIVSNDLLEERTSWKLYLALHYYFSLLFILFSFALLSFQGPYRVQKSGNQGQGQREEFSKGATRSCILE